jgi:NAD(P)-dependent dehydrogenase (short-subunit alcohol dehydrogenase family)
MPTVLITGANRGLGLALTEAYAAAGNTVLACCRAPERADALRALSTRHSGVRALSLDVGDGQSVAALKQSLGTQSIDILINNAGMVGPPPPSQSLAKMDYAGWAETFAVNTMAPFRMLQTFRENLKAGTRPKVASITSQFGAISFDTPMFYVYSSTKGALNKVMRMAAIELAKDGIAACVVHPGWVRTDMGGPQGQQSPEESAAGIVAVIDKLSVETTGSFKKWNGEDHAW